MISNKNLRMHAVCTTVEFISLSEAKLEACNGLLIRVLKVSDYSLFRFSKSLI